MASPRYLLVDIRHVASIFIRWREVEKMLLSHMLLTGRRGRGRVGFSENPILSSVNLVCSHGGHGPRCPLGYVPG